MIRRAIIAAAEYVGRAQVIDWDNPPANVHVASSGSWLDAEPATGGASD